MGCSDLRGEGEGEWRGRVGETRGVGESYDEKY